MAVLNSRSIGPVPFLLLKRDQGVLGQGGRCVLLGAASSGLRPHRGMPQDKCPPAAFYV